MGSDRARRSYDESRKYRSVVHQQGRVVLEADLNEAQQILTEETREEALDFVGPLGTPDDGYRIAFPPGSRDFSVGSGTLYVGGVRIYQRDAIKYSAQPDWIDGPDAFSQSASAELIFLSLREQEVSAVEDPALREVALGGPDTAQRLRLFQRAERRTTKKTTTDDAIAEIVDAWKAAGQSFDPKSQRLFSNGRLRVSPVTTGEAPDPCTPAAQDGYLGAENQLLRVQISAANKFLWAYDDASSLYPVKVETSTSIVNGVTKTVTKITLLKPPVDAYHYPRKGQRVELLRATASLGDDAYAAALSGFVAPTAVADGSYDPDTRVLTLTDTPPAAYTTAGAGGKPLFLRVWQDEVSFTTGNATELAGTGLQVTLSSGPFVVGDHWMFAARPSTPEKVYPEEYLTKARSPDGPRRWVAILSFVKWSGNNPSQDDLRPPFDNLVELTKRKGGGCCVVTLRPEDLKGGTTLQSIIDQHKETSFAGERLTICLMPGVYELDKPLRLDHAHSFLTIEGCHDGAVIQAAQGAEANFADGLVVLTHADNVTLRRLRFHLPLVRMSDAKITIAGLSEDQLLHLEGPSPKSQLVSIGVRPMHCAELAIEGCLFRFAVSKGEPLFAAGVFAGSECWGLDLSHNRFLHKDNYLRHEPQRQTFGYLIAPTVTAKLNGAQLVSGTVVRSLLTDAVIRDNVFSGLTSAALIFADIGVLTIDRNAVRECVSGFSLVALRSPLFTNLALRFHGLLKMSKARMESLLVREAVAAHRAVEEGKEDPGVTGDYADVTSLVGSLIVNPLLFLGSAVARGYPAPAGLPARHVRTVTLNTQPSSLHVALSDVEDQQFREIEAEKPVLHTSVHVTDNDIRAVVPAGPSSMALTMVLSERDPQSSAIVSANRMWTNGGGPVATILLALRCAVTGNLIIDEANEYSLVVFPGSTDQAFQGAAVTGNVLRGAAVLPPRTGSLPPWADLNSKIN